MKGSSGHIVVFTPSNCRLSEEISKNITDPLQSYAKVIKAEKKRGSIHLWLALPRGKKSVSRILARLSSSREASYSIIYSGSEATLIYVSVPRELCCSEVCPLFEADRDKVLISAVFSRSGLSMICAARRVQVLERLSRVGRVCRKENVRLLPALTKSQVRALVAAYREGYYKFPRQISLKELAVKLGSGLSTLAEKLRRAEARLVEQYVTTELNLQESRDLVIRETR